MHYPLNYQMETKGIGFNFWREHQLWDAETSSWLVLYKTKRESWISLLIIFHLCYTSFWITDYIKAIRIRYTYISKEWLKFSNEYWQRDNPNHYKFNYVLLITKCYTIYSRIIIDIYFLKMYIIKGADRISIKT